MNDTTRIQCDCKACNGKAADVPNAMVAGRTGKTLKSVEHNLVQLAHGSPMMAARGLKAIK